ncbi:MAG TPA: ROK family protein, partial [Streptosporangiaceae bacterium]|nr:ROK family protein [Streptosporangiaceae bacterium]
MISQSPAAEPDAAAPDTAAGVTAGVTAGMVTAGMVTVGIDLGGTGTRLVALDPSGVVRSRISVPTRHAVAADAGQLITELAGQVRDAAGGARLAGVGIGASGPVDPSGIIRNDATLPAYSHIPLGRLLGEHLGVPCAVDNDAVAFALGENAWGAGQRSPALLAVTLGTGIGVALLRDGVPYRGSDGIHPEAGHIPVPGPVAPCYCGLPTCWEQLGSRTALDAVTGQNTDELAAAAAAGDPASREVFDRYAGHVGTGLATLVSVFRPARVVVGGSAARYLTLLRPGIDRALSRCAPYDWNPPIAGAALGELSGAIGAAILG